MKLVELSSTSEWSWPSSESPSNDESDSSSSRRLRRELPLDDVWPTDPIFREPAWSSSALLLLLLRSSSKSSRLLWARVVLDISLLPQKVRVGDTRNWSEFDLGIDGNGLLREPPGAVVAADWCCWRVEETHTVLLCELTTDRFATHDVLRQRRRHTAAVVCIRHYYISRAAERAMVGWLDAWRICMSTLSQGGKEAS